MEQVITIHNDGSIKSLLAKKGQGVSIKELGEADIKRYSEVVFLKEYQKFAIKYLQEFVGEYLCVNLMRPYSLLISRYASDLYHKYLLTFNKSEPILLFDEYEDAVRAEIQFYNIVRASKMSSHITENYL